MINKNLKKRILDISYEKKLSHLGSCLTAVDIIDEIYQTKKLDEKFILSNGHAALALYCVIEKYEGLDAKKIFEHHGVHPDRCDQCHIYYSTGSLGQGLPATVGMALANREKNVYCLISDGECSEGSIFEAINVIKKYKIENLKLHINFNGWGAYDPTNEQIIPQVGKWYKTNVNNFPFLKDQDAHYHVMTEEEYKQGLEILE